MKTTNEPFLEQLDGLFMVSEGMIKDRGEDSYCCAARNGAALAGVFDGCGGLGSRTYEGFGGHTGAYVASRLVSGAVYDWFSRHWRDRWPDAQALLRSLDGYIRQAFAIGSGYAQTSFRIKGSMVRDFPTTAAIALVVAQPGGAPVLHVIWAGDSRVYLLSGRGLSQLSADDVAGEDALSNLSNDGILTNLLSSDGNYVLHHRALALGGPCMVFSATDGCFGYLPSPMDFEDLLLQSMAESETPAEFSSRLKAGFLNFAGDDFAFAGMSFGFGSFQGMHAAFAPRRAALERDYIRPLRDGAQIESLWQSYRVDYERYLFGTGGQAK